MTALDAAAVNAMLTERFPGASASCEELGDLFALADAALWYLTFTVIDRIEPMALTSELSIRFLRPAQGRVVRARADLGTATRRSVVGSVRVWMDDQVDRPSAIAQGTYVLPRS